MPGIALVTGASRGIGRAIAARLSRDGYQVALNDLPREQDSLEKTRAEISKNGGESSMFLADVSSEEQVKKMVGDVVKTMGGLDVMVANAGICVPSLKGLTEVTEEEFQKTLSVNTMGTFFCYKHAAKQMIEQGRGGRIIGAASVASKQGWAGLLAYSASKFSIRGLTQSSAFELGKYGITVNAYAPGPIDTEMLRSVFAPGAIGATSPIGRDGKPEDIAALVSYLVSKEAGMVTGQSVSINGGMFFD